jgi:hypothetical protein
MPNAATSNPQMTETIDSANAAATTLFLGHNGDWWDFWLIIAGICVAVAAIAVGVTTAGSLVAHKREALAAEQEFTKYKLDTAKDIADANVRTSQAQLELQRLKSWRMVDADTFKSALAGISAPTVVDILYVPECSDCFMLGSMLQALFNDMRWPCSFSEIKKLDPPPYDWMKGMPAVLQHRANPTGISIVTNKVGEFGDKSVSASLVRAIGKSVQGINMQWSRDEMMPDGVVRIVIAPKL